MIKTVLELDLAGYNDIARVLEENLSVAAVEAFEDQIQRFVDEGLAAVGLRREEIVLGTAGDNAILMFDDAAQMHHFAETVQQATRDHNRGKSLELAKRWFRMGAATGIVRHKPEERRVVGTTISRAVRLEAAGRKGQLLIDTATWQALPEALRECYGPEEEVQGKRENERFQVRRWVLIPPDEIEAAPPRRRTGLTAAAAAALVVLLALFGFFGRERLVIPETVAESDRQPGETPVAPEQPQPADATTTADATKAEPLTGRVHVKFWRPDDPTRRNVLVSDAGALPVRMGDQIRIEAEVNRPAYLYLIWIEPDGNAVPVHPWSPGDWTRLPGSVAPRQSLSLPEAQDRGWPMAGGPGMETLLLLARETPLPEGVPLDKLFAGLPPQTMQDERSVVYLDRDMIVRDEDTQRGPKFYQEESIDDPVLTTQRLLTERLTRYFDVIQAVSFANRGGER